MKKAEEERKIAAGHGSMADRPEKPQPSKSFFGRGKTQAPDEEMGMNNLNTNRQQGSVRS